ncbi:hypothetical protein Cpin_4638 [Chitinophaga pinensis DSM 2588]|uniref:Uncharacterized protein n=1 Tax=Chitinophaga pinensis (strain ATCC 43595 / DSM 2588 / LMG 13176 / NBRC 15968 / NCIMB 11800 / UQM 2034) TaxID=485918 RepID=A0A979G6Z9_CHIPD|nr:hypothetical protein Cpin_4638 [Chitinophaga pinensis DSM 2588]
MYRQLAHRLLFLVQSAHYGKLVKDRNLNDFADEKDQLLFLGVTVS